MIVHKYVRSRKYTSITDKASAIPVEKQAKSNICSTVSGNKCKSGDPAKSKITVSKVISIVNCTNEKIDCAKTNVCRGKATVRTRPPLPNNELIPNPVIRLKKDHGTSAHNR